MRGSYTAGVVVALLEAGIDLSWVGGISAGATNACNYVSRDVWRTRASFTDFATDPSFGGWRSFARGHGMFNSDYIYQRSGLPDAALPFAWDAYAANPAQMRIGAFDADSGETVYWGRDDMATLTDMSTRIQASSSMPVLMPSVHLDGRVYVDGALGSSAGIPLDAAEDDGYDKHLIVLSQPRDYVKEPQGHARFLSAYYRRHPAVARALSTRAERYNAMRERIFELEKAGRAYVLAPGRPPVASGERDLGRLRESYRVGLDQAQEELPAITEFLGVTAGSVQP